MQKMHDTLRHASKEGRLEFFQKIFRLLADFHSSLENEIIERQENLDRAIWLYTSELSGDRGHQEKWMKLCEESFAQAQMEMADFLSLLWAVSENPSDWMQKYREETYYFESPRAGTAHATPSEGRHPQAAAPSRAKKTAGRPPLAQQATVKQMNTDLDGEALSEERLRVMPITSLAGLYRVHHTVAKKARDLVLRDRASGRGEALCGNSTLELAQPKSVKKTDA